jgi:hypothetical protein
MNRGGEKHQDKDGFRRPQDEPEGKPGGGGQAREKDTPYRKDGGMFREKNAGQQDEDGNDFAPGVEAVHR